MPVLGGASGAANGSEVAQRVHGHGHGHDWTLARSLHLSCGLVIEPATVDDAERAARSWRSGQGFSLAYRLCLALGDRMDVPVLTADRAWGVSGRIRQIREGWVTATNRSPTSSRACPERSARPRAIRPRVPIGWPGRGASDARRVAVAAFLRVGTEGFEPSLGAV